MRRVSRLRAQCSLDHRSNLIVGDRSRAAWPSLIKQTIAAILQKSATPLANCVFVKPKLRQPHPCSPSRPHNAK
jgi:hypothetical protein